MSNLLARTVPLFAVIICVAQSLAVQPLHAQQPLGASPELVSLPIPSGTEPFGPGYVPGLHMRVLLLERRLLLQDGGIVLLDAPVSVGRPDTLWYRGRGWTFATPPGRRVVLAKEADPVWTPPDWHYAERAKENDWEMVQLQRGSAIPLADGSRLTVRGQRVVRAFPGGRVEPVPLGADIAADGLLVVPPFGTADRRLRGQLGRFKLDLGDGYLIHGTPREETIGGAVTHGCVQVADEHLEMLFRVVPVGTPVYIY